MTNAFNRESLAGLSRQEQALIERRERVLGAAYRLFYEKPVHFVRGEGVWLHDAKSERYLDAYNNVVSVGHCHPKVVEAISRQTATLNTHTRYLSEAILDYAESLVSTFPAPLSQIMFTCTGSEANDLAVRIARHVTGGTGIIVTELAYHGLTGAVAAFSPSLGEHVALGAHVRTVKAPDAYRAAPEEVRTRFGSDVQAAIADLERHGIKPALLIVDSIFSSDGVFADPAGFIKPAAEAIRKAGGLFVADEVQPGFGRTGETLWGFMRHGVEPDLVTLGKPMGNGYPIAGVVAKPALLDDFGRKARYFNTFGGNPVAISAASAVLQVIQDEGLQQNAFEVGNYLRAALKALQASHPTIGHVRGAGLFIGVEMVEDPATKSPSARLAARLVNGLRERRVLISSAGPHANVLKIRPPLTFSKENADTLVAALADTLKTL